MSEPFDQFTDEPVETGFTVAVTDSDGLTPAAVQAAKALVNLPELSPVALAQIARDIAQDIAQLPAILAKHKLTRPQYEFLEKHNKFFINVLAGEITNWQSIKSTEMRLRLQAQAAIEQQLPGIAGRMGNAAEKLGDVVEAFKAVARVAGVDTPPAGPVAAGARYQIVIDLGADTNVVIAAKGGTAPGAGAAQSSAISQDPQAGGNAQPLQHGGQGQGHLLALPALSEG